MGEEALQELFHKSEELLVIVQVLCNSKVVIYMTKVAARLLSCQSTFE